MCITKPHHVPYSVTTQFPRNSAQFAADVIRLCRVPFISYPNRDTLETRHYHPDPHPCQPAE